MKSLLTTNRQILDTPFGALLQREALNILSTPDEVRQIAATYFSSTHARLPMISESRFYDNISKLFTPAGIDFTVLCLCIKLIQIFPPQQITVTVDMASSHYHAAKSGISVLEATGHGSLTAIQSRLLVVLYEMGHGLYPAASVSIGACARLLRNIGLGSDSSHLQGDTSIGVDAEERKRTWWAVHNLDRYALSSCRHLVPCEVVF